MDVFLSFRKNINLLNMNMADWDGASEDGTKTDQVTENPEGVLQLIDKLENIVDQMLQG